MTTKSKTWFTWIVILIVLIVVGLVLAPVIKDFFICNDSEKAAVEQVEEGTVPTDVTSKILDEAMEDYKKDVVEEPALEEQAVEEVEESVTEDEMKDEDGNIKIEIELPKKVSDFLK